MVNKTKVYLKSLIPYQYAIPIDNFGCFDIKFFTVSIDLKAFESKC